MLNIYLYICMYAERERERERDNPRLYDAKNGNFE
jgi:hypothetical protein